MLENDQEPPAPSKWLKLQPYWNMEADVIYKSFFFLPITYNWMAYYFFLRALTISQQFPPLAHHNQTSQYLWYWCIAETTLSACGCTSWENRSSSLSWAFSLSIFDSSAARAALVALIIKIINRSHLMSVQYMKWRSKAMSQGMHKSPFSVFFLVIRHRVFAKTQNIFSNSFFSSRLSLLPSHCPASASDLQGSLFEQSESQTGLVSLHWLQFIAWDAFLEQS